LQVTLLPTDSAQGMKFMLFQDKTKVISLTKSDAEGLHGGMFSLHNHL